MGMCTGVKVKGGNTVPDPGLRVGDPIPDPGPGVGDPIADACAALAEAGGSPNRTTVGRLGGIRSLVQVYTAGVGSTFPAASMARTLRR
jgi:hypothetical protein